LSKRIEVLQTNLARSNEEASLDPSDTRFSIAAALTGPLSNGDRTLRKRGKPFVLAMLDLDDFKQINDTHGHQLGDRVLLCAAQWFGKYVRGSDFLDGTGGEGIRHHG